LFLLFLYLLENKL